MIGFTNGPFGLEELEGVWRDRRTRPTFLLPLDDNAAAIRVQLHNFEGEPSNVVEIEVRGIFLCLAAASGSREALEALFSAPARQARADRFAFMFVLEGVLDVDWPRDSHGVPTDPVTAARVNEWLEENEGRVVWDEEKRTWTLEDDNAGAVPQSRAVEK